MQHLTMMNRLVGQPDGASRHYKALLEEARAFHSQFKSPGAVFPSQQADEMRPILSALCSPLPVDLEMYLAKTLKILLRKSSNRQSLGRMGISLLVNALEKQVVSRTPAAAELGNVVINSCYNGDANVRSFVECNGLTPLLQLLRTQDIDLVQSVLGALQGICFVPYGRQFVREDFEALQIMCLHLESTDCDVRARAVGCIHNLSADAISLSLLRDAGCIRAVSALLRDSSPDLCRAAAGIIQNMSREPLSREAFANEGAVPGLSDLLISSDVDCQAASVGALLNMLSPTLPPDQLPQLKKALTDGVVMGVINSSLFESK